MAIYAVTFPESVAIRTGLLILGMVVFGLVAWRLGLNPSERVFFMRQRMNASFKINAADSRPLDLGKRRHLKACCGPPLPNRMPESSPVNRE